MFISYARDEESKEKRCSAANYVIAVHQDPVKGVSDKLMVVSHF